MVRYINQLICIFTNINENCKNKVKIIKNSLKQISGRLWCTERRGVQWVKRLKTIVCPITDVSSSYNMTAIKLQTTIPVNFNCYLLLRGLPQNVTLLVGKSKVRQDLSLKILSNQHCCKFLYHQRYSLTFG